MDDLLTETPATDDHLVAVERYYEETWVEYRCMWMSDKNKALHMGYWTDGVTSHAESLDRMNEEMAAKIGLRGGERVLDAGCGVGATALWLAEHHDAHVSGVTISSDQVVKAERYARDRGLSAKADFSRQDYLATEFDDATFDLVWAQESVCHASSKDRFVEEAYRVLKPGGRLVLADLLQRRAATTRRDQAVDAAMQGGWLFGGPLDARTIQCQLADAGFVDATVEDVTPAVLRSMRRLNQLVVLVAPILWVLDRRDFRSAEQRGNTAAVRAAWKALRSQLYVYGFVTARKPDVDGAC